ncbi:hypothetical protein DFQ26_009846, partial [Actinomortierella ambigua]
MVQRIALADTSAVISSLQEKAHGVEGKFSISGTTFIIVIRGINEGNKMLLKTAQWVLDNTFIKAKDVYLLDLHSTFYYADG